MLDKNNDYRFSLINQTLIHTLVLMRFRRNAVRMPKETEDALALDLTAGDVVHNHGDNTCAFPACNEGERRLV